MSDSVAQHLRACDGFGRAVEWADGHWEAPSPCAEWDARGVLEHVIGFHDALVLRPMNAKPARPRDDPAGRWAATAAALSSALAQPGVLDAERVSLLGVLATDVLVHTWDLSRAVGREVTLDPDLCAIGLERAVANAERFADSPMFGPPVPVAPDATVQDRLLAFMGRDPAWKPPTT